MADKWYNSTFMEYFGGGMAVTAIIVGTGIGFKSCSEGKAELERARQELPLQKAYLNGNKGNQRPLIIPCNLSPPLPR